VFGKHTLSLKVGIVGTEAQAQLGLVGPIDNPRTFFFLKVVWTQPNHTVGLK